MTEKTDPSPDDSTDPQLPRCSTGIDGLDQIMNGGLIRNRGYLVRGDAGTGKTLIGLHFLTEGARNDETTLFVNLEESTDDIRLNAATLGFDLDGVEFLDLSQSAEFFTENQQYDVFEPSDVERDPVIDAITDRVTSLEPDRVFVDPISQLRYLSSDTYQFRKHTLSFMRLLRDIGATVLFTTQTTADAPDEHLQFMGDGTISLGYDSTGRSISVPKLRGSAVKSGEHSMSITGDGVLVFPELSPGDHTATFHDETMSSGVPEIDDLLNGGFERGTVTVISGPTGVGKTTTGTQFMQAAASRDERSLIYLFEESKDTFVNRSESIGIPVTEMEERGTLVVREIEPLRISPQELAQTVRAEIEEAGADIVMLDGIAGYKLGVKGDEDELVTNLHSLNRYLKNMGVTVILIDELDSITGEFSATNVGISYLADNIVFLRHLELNGEMRKVIGVLKKRTSDFERTLREFKITGDGIVVGDPLTQLRGILSGNPEFVDGFE